MIIIIESVHASPSDVDEFLADFRALSLRVRARGGCLFYTVALEDASAGRLLVAERWQDQAALTAHLGSTETSAFVEKWMHRMQGEMQKYDASNERAVMSQPCIENDNFACSHLITHEDALAHRQPALP